MRKAKSYWGVLFCLAFFGWAEADRLAHQTDHELTHALAHEAEECGMLQLLTAAPLADIEPVIRKFDVPTHIEIMGAAPICRTPKTFFARAPPHFS